MDLERLSQPQEPWPHRLVAMSSDACNIFWSLERDAPRAVACRVIRGRKSPTVADLLGACDARQLPAMALAEDRQCLCRVLAEVVQDHNRPRRP